MPEFRYKAYDAGGKQEAGAITAETESAALDLLANRGLTPFSIGEGTDDRAVPWWAREVAFLGDTVPRRELAQFFRALALIHGARLPLPAALRLATAEATNRRLGALLATAEREVTNGRRFADALQGHESIVPARFVSLIRVGEEANRLADMAGRAADILERELSYRSELRSALTYPLILLVASILVLGMLIFLLAPTLAPVFAAVHAEPPLMVWLMLGVRGFLADYGLAVGLAGLAALTLLVIALRGERRAVQNLLLRAPVTGSLMKASESARAFTTLSLMLESGATILTALSAARDACASSPYRDLFIDAETKIRSGSLLSEALGSNDLIPPLALRLIRTGEQSDHLSEMLANAGKALDSQARNRVQRLVSLLTPVLTILIGGIVGTLIYTTLTAILDINDIAL